MEIEYNETKNESNYEKHQVYLKEAEHIEWDTLWAKLDERKQYDEKRMIGYAYIRQRLYCVVYVDKPNNIRRIISLRKANSREVKNYAEA
jgi:uncharacterized DUF497 family protein